MDSFPSKILKKVNTDTPIITVSEPHEQIIPVPSTQKSQPAKPLSSYFIFRREYKKSHPKLSFKDLAQVWSDMPVDEKIIYTQMAEQEKIRYQKDLEHYLESQDNFENQNANEKDLAKAQQISLDLEIKENTAVKSQEKNQNIIDQEEEEEEFDLIFPLSRIKNILKQDLENKLIKKSALVFIEQATELFGEYLLKQICDENKTSKKKKKRLQHQELFDQIKKNKKLAFLKGTGILKIIKEEPTQNAAKPEKQEKLQPDIKNNYKISDFFKKKV